MKRITAPGGIRIYPVGGRNDRAFKLDPTSTETFPTIRAAVSAARVTLMFGKRGQKVYCMTIDGHKVYKLDCPAATVTYTTFARACRAGEGK